MQLLRKTQSNRPKREAYFVRVPTPDGKAAFVNATEHIGQPMPYAKPQATCAMRVTDSSVVFSFLQLNKKSVKNIADSTIEIPRGPLAKLERKAGRLSELGTDRVVVEISTARPARKPRPTDSTDSTDSSESAAVSGGGDSSDSSAVPAAPAAEAPAAAPAASTADPVAGPVVSVDPVVAPGAPVPDAGLASLNGDAPAAATVTAAPAPPPVLRYELELSRDENGCATLDTVDGPAEPYDLPFGAVRASVYLRSPAVDRVIGVTFIGYPGRPGTTETVTRVASMILFSMSQLTEFRILSGIETVHVPAPPTRWAAAPPVRRAEDEVSFSVPVWLFSEDLSPAGAGSIGVTVDLENANPSSDRLLFHFAPDESIAELFPTYRQVFEMSVSEFLRLHLGDDEVASITYDIVLNAIDSGTLERLREAAATIPGLDLTPQQKRVHE